MDQEKLVALFQQEFERCKVSKGESAIVLSGERSSPAYAKAALQAIAANPFSASDYLNHSLVKQAEFRLDDSGYALLVNIFTVCYAGMYPVAGWLVDRWGARRMMLAMKHARQYVALAALMLATLVGCQHDRQSPGHGAGHQFVDSALDGLTEARDDAREVGDRPGTESDQLAMARSVGRSVTDGVGVGRRVRGHPGPSGTVPV